MDFDEGWGVSGWVGSSRGGWGADYVDGVSESNIFGACRRVCWWGSWMTGSVMMVSMASVRGRFER